MAIGRGSEHEGRKLIPLLRSIKIKHGKGRPRKNPKRVYADTKYSMALNRFYLDNRKVISQIPSTVKKKRPVRYERLAETFSGLFHIACIMILWRILR